MTTKRRAAMWVSFKTCTAALVALWLVAGCGKAMTTESGETHFVSCDTDADCAGVSGAHTCKVGLCRGPANESSSSTTSTPACDGGCGDSECGTPGSCSLAAACKVVDCGTATFDDNACVRPSCQSDADCGADERCASIWLGRHYECKQSGNSCDCTAGLGLFPLNICSPVEMAGARGDWQSLLIGESVIGDTTEHTFATDGSVTVKLGEFTQGGPSTTQVQLSVDDLDQLQRLINGPDLRRDLADPKDCPLTKEYDAVVQLQLDGTLLEKNVAGCLSDGADGVASFVALMDLVRRY
jgi:hypothetical protein